MKISDCIHKDGYDDNNDDLQLNTIILHVIIDKKTKINFTSMQFNILFHLDLTCVVNG